MGLVSGNNKTTAGSGDPDQISPSPPPPEAILHHQLPPKMVIIFAVVAVSCLVLYHSSITFPFSGDYNSSFAAGTIHDNSVSICIIKFGFYFFIFIMLYFYICAHTSCCIVDLKSSNHCFKNHILVVCWAKLRSIHNLKLSLLEPFEFITKVHQIKINRYVFVT